MSPLRDPGSSPLAGAVWAIGILAVFTAVSAAVGWGEARLLGFLGAPALPLWGLPVIGAATIFVALAGAMYSPDLRARLASARRPRGAGREVEGEGEDSYPPPADPPLGERAVGQGEIEALQAAVRRGVCPRCGAGGFRGAEEEYAHSVDGFARDGRGLAGGTVYKARGRCLACGYAREIPFMR